MSRLEFLYLLPAMLSFALAVVITVYAWLHRQVRGASAFGFVSLAHALASLANILELLSPDVAGKLLWDKVHFIGYSLGLVAIPYFAARYTTIQIKRPGLLVAGLSIVPALMTLAVLTDRWTHLLYPIDIGVRPDQVFTELDSQLGPVHYAFAAYGYLAVMLALVVLGRQVRGALPLHRRQLVAVMIGFMLPVISTAATMLGIRLSPLRDSTPAASAIGNLIVTYSIFSLRWLDVAHIARDKLVQDMDDFVFVLDAQDCIVDMNASAQAYFGLSPSRAIGVHAAEALAAWPDLLEDFRHPSNTHREYIVQDGDEWHHFDVRSTLFFSPRNEYQGRLFVARDITAYAQLQWQLKQLNEGLEQRVHERTQQLQQAYDTTLEGWARALELRDKETVGHSARVTAIAVKLAAALHVPDDQMDDIRRGALLHDIGKMALPDELLRKSDALTPEDWQVIRQHPTTGYQLLSRIPFLSTSLDIPYCHHEKWDGSGYPRGLKGEEIPLPARIFAVVDVWDAVQSDRPYKRGWRRGEAQAYIREHAGTHFDARVVDAFLGLVDAGQV